MSAARYKTTKLVKQPLRKIIPTSEAVINEEWKSKVKNNFVLEKTLCDEIENWIWEIPDPNKDTKGGITIHENVPAWCANMVGSTVTNYSHTLNCIEDMCPNR